MTLPDAQCSHKAMCKRSIKQTQIADDPVASSALPTGSVVSESSPDSPRYDAEQQHVAPVPMLQWC